MGMELTELAKELPPPSATDTDPAHGDADNLDALDALESAFADNEEPDDEQPDLTDEPAEPDEKKTSTEDESKDKDAADDAGQQGEEAEEPDDSVSNQEEPTTDPDVLVDAKPEDYQRVSASMNGALAQLDEQLKERAQPIAQNILNRVNQINSRLKEIAAQSKNEEGFDVPLPLNLSDERQDLRREYERLRENALQLDAWRRENGSQGSGGQEIVIQHNMQLWPQLQKYEKQYRQCVASGMDCSDPHYVFDVCRSMHRRENPEPARPAVSKADIEKQALQDNLERKQRGGVSAGKSSGAKAPTAKAVPDAVKREMESFSRYFHDGDDD